MRTLVTWGSKLGGTAGIGYMLADALRARGIEVVATAASNVSSLEGFDAVVLGGALYANRWPMEARRFAKRHQEALRRLPVWLFSSGPLDDSAAHGEIPPSHQVETIAERIGALEHVTFGGRLEESAKGFPAEAMAKKMAGDFRDPAQIALFGEHIADLLPTATPGPHVDHPAARLSRQLGYATLAWASFAPWLLVLASFDRLAAGLVMQAIAAPLGVAWVAVRHFRAKGAPDPLPTAAGWTLWALLLQLLVTEPLLHGMQLWHSFGAGYWPLLATFLVTFGVGFMMSTMPWPAEPKDAPAKPSRPAASDA